MDTNWQKIEAKLAARQLSDLLDRVRDRGEQFLIERDGEPIAKLSPIPRKSGTLGDLISMLADSPPLDPGFEKDLAEIRSSVGGKPND